jgi:hypothetical protein
MLRVQVFSCTDVFKYEQKRMVTGVNRPVLQYREGCHGGEYMYWQPIRCHTTPQFWLADDIFCKWSYELCGIHTSIPFLN